MGSLDLLLHFNRSAYTGAAGAEKATFSSANQREQHTQAPNATLLF